MASSLGESDTEATATAAGAASSNTTSPLPMSPSNNNNANKDPLLAQEGPPSSPSESIEKIQQNGSSAQNVPLNGNSVPKMAEMTTTADDDADADMEETEDTTAVVVTTSAAPNDDNAPPSPPAAAATTTDDDQQQFSSHNNNNNHDVSSTTAMEETTTASSTTVMASSSLVVLEEQQLVVSSSPQSTTFKQIIAEEQEEEQQQQQQEEKQPAITSTTVASLKEDTATDDTTSNTITPATTTTTTIHPRPKVSDKSPRKENDWLRSPTSIGDGYTKIVREISKLRQFLLVANSNNNSNSNNTDNTTSGADEKSLDPSPSNAADSAAALGGAGGGATSSPSGNGGNSSVIEKLGMWINGAKSPPSSQTTTATTNNNSNNHEEEANHESQHQQQQQIVQEEEDTEKQVQQRLEIIEQHAKSLMTSQRSGFLNTNYDLPMLVLKELDLIKSQLDQCWNTTTSNDDVVVMNDRSYSGTDDTNHNDGADVGYDEKKNELEQAKETYESIKSFSMELESKLEQEIQKVMENRKVKITEGQGPPLPPPPPPSAATDGIGEGESSLEQQQPTTTTTAAVSTEVQKKKRKRVGAKCLSKVRQSWEMSNGIGGGGATTTTTTSTTTRRRVQFLSSSSTSRGGGGGDYGTTTTNFRNRKTYDKSLSEIIANIPDNDNDDDDVTNGSLTTNNNGMMIMMKKGSSHVVSYESINGVIPTMAPPMLDGQPTIPPDYAAAFGKNKKRKRGLRDSSGSTASSIDGGGGKGGASQTKNKRFRRGDSSVSRTSAAAVAGEGGGAAFPSSSTTKESSSSSTTNLHVRILPDTTPRPKVAFVEGDTNPNRLTNPLLRLPQFPDGLDPPIEEIPQGGELWSLADLHWHDPDTYPISYLARLLGFDVPEEGVDEPFAEKFDPMTVKMMKDDTDPWACMPDCGSFIDRVWKKEDTTEGTGKCDDLNLSYCDPLWANIISSYRGFNEGDFKDAGKGFTDDLLPDCLNFAQERGILSKEKGVSFRFGTPKDEELLQPLADKCSWKSHQKHDLATSLRGQSSFCIIAQSADSGVIAFIQYSFCWYRVEEKISAASGAEKVSELVVFIDALVYDSNMGAVTEGSSRISHDDLECVKTLLTSLALIHAARANIWYGMVDSPQPLVQFFTKYFRMSTIGRETVGAVPLVFDLKKCHFRYAILLLEETLKMKESKKSDLKLEGAGERMIVRLPANAFELRSNISSASKDSRSKKARIRLVQDGNKTEMFSVSANTAEEEESLTIVDPNSFDANTPTQWNVLRLFPLGDKKSLKDGTSASPTDGFLDELEKKQRELASLEASIEVTARGILTKAYEETSEFHRNGSAAKRQQDEKTLDEYAAVQKRLHEADLAWQAQLDQDMDAVCDICFDGEVTPENQIIFCDTCNVAVHQGCYGIDKVPSGNYFCRACTHFDIDKEFLAAERRRGPRTKPTRPHINCELCPRRHGAFVLVDSPEPADLEPTNKPKKAKWVHVSCAKWHGMNYVDIELKDKIEDVTVLKNWFKDAGHKCCLCDSGVGAMHQCRHEGCGEWLHLTCARSIGTCSVQHGENCFGFYDETKLKNPPWTLACPNHSEVDPESIREDSLTIEQLVTIANSYPPEPVPPKPFYKMNGAERKEYWADKDNLNDFFRKVTSNLSGAKCDICEIAHDPNDTNKSNQFCPECGAFSHSECADPDRREDGICYRCRFVAKNKNSDDYVEPQCHMCNTSTLVGGPLVKTYAKPLTMKKWTNNKAAFKRSLYGPNNFCHTLCGLWNNKCTSLDGGQVIDCFNIIMSDGRRHVTHQFRCFLCGKSNGAKVHCVEEGCVAPGGTKIPYFHVTCARQAGLEVSSDPDFVLACFHHADSSHVFRARLEDFMEIEIMRYSEKAQMKNVLKISSPMSWDHASKLFHSAVIVLRTLGWAWRWAEWWVASGDNWEPLIRDDQNEAEMTDKELKKVESTPESRCNDARRSRLAALGAALRNRDYDKIEGDDQEPLERALMAVMSIPSLVGPLKQKEKEFYVTWLSLAYRSATPKLGFGDHKTPVASDSYCVHQADGSPKFELGSRPLPGKTPPEKENGFFEPLVDEPDDFLKEPTSGSPIRKKRQRQSA